MKYVENNHIYNVKALDNKVLAVASIFPETTPKQIRVYIGACEGKRHSTEWRNVRDRGSTQHERIGKAIFPEYDRDDYHWLM